MTDENFPMRTLAADEMMLGDYPDAPTLDDERDCVQPDCQDPRLEKRDTVSVSQRRDAG